jgi:cellulose synthase/poly-beta-1,6-N-acetylglucosamine synthase-like glycosyltransferase
MFSDYKSSKKMERTDLSVSIIIPAYNEEKSIVRTIDSAVNLDYPRKNMEIIVVDDGSKDSTYSLAKEHIDFLRKKYSSLNIKVFTKKNGGKGSALNLGIEKCSGEIVVSMDADTFANPDAIKKMMGYFYNEEVMSVTPTLAVYQPKTIWQRVQHIEYYLGTFLRKSFALLNAMHVYSRSFCCI